MKHSGYLTTSGAEIYYEQYGSGTPLLILHGNSQSLAVFYPFLRTFLPDFQVILMDSRGHGRSRLSVHTALHGFSTEDMADDVIALLNHLHLSSVHLLGFSDGANIGLEIACKYPKRLKKLAHEQQFEGGKHGWGSVRMACVDLEAHKLCVSRMGDSLKNIMKAAL